MKKQVMAKEQNLKGFEKLKKFSKVTTPTVAIMAMLLASPVNEVKAEENNNGFKEVVVIYKNEEGKKLVLNSGMKVEATLENLKMITGAMSVEEIQKLQNNENIEAIEENMPLRIIGGENIKSIADIEPITSHEDFFPVDAYRGWNIGAMNARVAWTDGYTGKGVKIAVIDSGADMDHPDLNLAGGVTMVEGQDSYEDLHGHGTHVAGVISGKLDGNGVAGVAPDAEVYAVKVMDDAGNIYIKDVVEGIEWSIQNGIDIINLSLATPQRSTILERALEEAYSQGILIVAGVGNSGNDNGTGDTVEYPALFDEVIAVTAVDEDMNRGSFASTGNGVEFSAPGVGIISTYKNGGYAEANGTSQATPHVTALLALLKEKYPYYSNKELRSELLKYAIDLGEEGKDSHYGYGFVKYLSNPNEPVKEEPTEEGPQEENPNEDEPTDETPVDEVPVEEEPVDETPIDENPVEETPIEEEPIEEEPVEEEPIEEEPIDEIPTEDPVEEEPVDETPIEEEPTEEVPVEETPTDEIPVEEEPIEENPEEEMPAEEEPEEETPIETPIDETPTDETPIEQPVEETPIEEPIDEEPVDETPIVENPPINDTPVDDVPIIVIPDKNPPIIVDNNNNSGSNKSGSRGSGGSSKPKISPEQKEIIKKAEELIEIALKERTNEAINQAFQQILKVDDIKERQRLVKSIDVLVKELGIQAEKAVSRYEKYKSFASYMVAREQVNNLVFGNLRAELNRRLERATIDAIKEASETLNKFNLYRTAPLYFQAKMLINELPPVEVKNILLEVLFDIENEEKNNLNL